MSSWDRHLDDLATATSRLLLLGDIPLATPMADTRSTLASRDTYVARLADLIGSLTDSPAAASTSPRPQLTLLDITQRPGPSLHRALTDLPPTAGSLSDQTVVPVTALPPYAQLWSDAARACLALEQYVEPLTRVQDRHAWTVLRDLADLAAAVPLLDHGLSEALLPALKGGADLAVPYAMLTHARHDAVRLCADEIRSRVPAGAPAPTTGAVVPQVMGPGELDRAMARYVRCVQERAGDLSVTDLRAVTRLIEFGGDDAARVLQRTSSAVPCGAEVAKELQSVAVLAGQLRESPARTLGPERPDVLGDSTLLQQQVRTLAIREHQLPHGTPDADLRRLAAPALEFAKHLPDLTRALEVGVRESLADGLMLSGAAGRAADGAGNVRWLPSGREGGCALVGETPRVQHDASALASAAERVGPPAWTAQGELRRHRQYTDQPVASTATGAEPDVEAGIARAQFRAVLGQQLAKRSGTDATPLTSHPRVPAEQHGHGRSR